MRDDLKAAFRSLRTSPSFTVVALIMLTLGIGASTAIFSVVDAVVLRALPFDEHDRLVAVGERRATVPRPGAGSLVLAADPNRDPLQLSSIAPQNYLDWVAQQQVFDFMTAIQFGAYTLREPGGEPEELRAQRVTASFFDVLRVRPAIGRAFTTEHEADGRDQVVVLSDGLWRRRFGADPGMVGRTIPLEGSSYEVLGIMPPDFAYPVGVVRPMDLLVPYVVAPSERTRNPQSHSYYLDSIARLKPGVSLDQAQAQMDQIAEALEQAHPEWNKGHTIGVRPLHDHIVGARTRAWMLMLMGAVALVLLIACANVANLMLARATAREREIGVRAALGAGRWRLVRQLLTESVALSTAGTLLGILFAWWGIQVLRTSMPEGVPRVTHIGMNLRVLGAAALLSLFTGILFGLLPAWQLSRPDLTRALNEGSRGAGSGARRQRIRSALVVGEVALAVVLLVGAALFIGSFMALMRIDPGFSPERVLTANVFPRFEAGKPPPNSSVALTDIVERVALAPGVVHAAVISCNLPLGGSSCSTSLTVPGRELPDKGRIGNTAITPDYHRTLRIPLRRGRFFADSDRADAPAVAIINEAAARKYFPGEDPIGHSVAINKIERSIVGIVGDVHQSSLETEPREEVYVPIAQQSTFGGSLVIRTSGTPSVALPATRAAVLAVLPDVPLRGVRTMEELLATRVAQRRLNMLLLGLFGLLGLVIAAVGIYGVLSYVVAQRTREIGVRMALGATRGRVIGMIMTDAALLLAVGLTIGTAGAWYLRTAAESFLFRVEAGDPRAFAVALVALGCAGLVAAALPARRAAGVDPIVALRAE